MVIWSLFDGSGYMGYQAAIDGHQVYCFNADDADHGPYNKAKVQHENIHYINIWIDKDFDPCKMGVPEPDIIYAFPPCTDIAVSGAAHFARKKISDPHFQERAIETARIAEFLGDKYGVTYMVENPVSVLATKWRKPDYTFHPYEFGGYLPEDDKHPAFPQYIKPRDAYPKKTCLWVGNGFVFPKKKPVDVNSGYSDQHKKLGGKSQKTKVIRSLTPRGMALAIHEANHA